LINVSKLMRGGTLHRVVFPVPGGPCNNTTLSEAMCVRVIKEDAQGSQDNMYKGHKDICVRVTVSDGVKKKTKGTRITKAVS
jgi:hypothetical protein